MNKIKMLREKKGISQRELAQKLNISSATLCGYEAGKHEASLETYRKIAQILECDLDSLLGGSGIKQVELRTVTKFPELCAKYETLDEIDRARVLAYIDGLLTAGKYSSQKMA